MPLQYKIVQRLLFMAVIVDLNFTNYTFSAVYSVHYALYGVYSVRRTVYAAYTDNAVHSIIVGIVLSMALYTVQLCTRMRCPVYSVQCIVYIV